VDRVWPRHGHRGRPLNAIVRFQADVDRLKSIDLLLAAIAGMLDEAAGEIRSAELKPTDEHLRRIGQALNGIFGIREAIFAVRPDLKPNWVSAMGPPSPDNHALTTAIVESIEYEKRNDYPGAIALFEAFLQSASSPLHKDIAQDEIQRLRGKLET
jgi:hypothetical protein